MTVPGLALCARRGPASGNPGVDAGRSASVDRDLVRRLLGGCSAADREFGRRLDRVRYFVRGINRRRGAPIRGDDLADLEHEAILVVWRKLPEFRGDSAFETWAFRIAHFEFRNAVRRQSREAERRVDFTTVADHMVTTVDEGPDNYDFLVEVLAQIDPEQARVIRLKHLDGFTFVELAVRIGVPVDTAKSRYYRGMRELQQRFGSGR